LAAVRFFLTFFALALAAAPVLAGVDYKIDPTFSPALGDGVVKTVVVRSDGKILVGGDFRSVNGVDGVYYLARLNADGTADPTFNSQLTFPTEHALGVNHIKPLPNGQFLITGNFRIGSQNVNYARINSDGSIDATMAAGRNSGEVEPLPDGKFLVCGSRLIGGQTYQIVHRLNPDGSPDPGNIAVPADYDGDGKTDIAIYRNGIWWQYLSATGSINIVYWGLGSDLPIAAQSQ
jgi:uncharacterized delta-60 repeat protein